MLIGRRCLAPVLVCVALASAAASAYGQAGAVTGQQLATNGLQNSWDVRKIIADMQNDTLQLRPLLLQVQPQEWVNQRGAPTTYILQWQAGQQQLNDLINVLNLFSRKTESLSQGLDTYFRLEALETTERSLAEGASHYDTRAVADKLNGMISHNFTSRERLREYLRELAGSTEANFKIADEEAQRCRGMLSQQATPTSSSRKSRK